jgi:pimeloyl-ACP methyl ester carboxylesterase
MNTVRIVMLCLVAVAAGAPASASAQLDIDLDFMADDLRLADVSGTRLAYVESGQGEPVILVHGAFSDYRYWEPQFKDGAERFHLYAYSRRDFYPNPQETATALQTEDRETMDLIEFIEALEIGPVHLVGHSAGGHTALLVAIRRQDLVRSVVLEEGGFVSDHPASMEALNGMPPVIDDYMRLRASGDLESAVERFIDFVSGDGFFASASSSARRLMLDNESAYGIRPVAPLACSDVASVELPVLMVLGELSPKFTADLLSGVRDCLSNEKTVTIEGASHDIHNEQAAAFNRAVFDFISGQSTD